MRIRISIFQLLLLIMLWVNPAAAAPGERLALVIGNASYQNEQPLANTLNDARDMAAKLQTLGFQVELQENLGVRAMRRTVNRFLGQVERRTGIALIYFSGHGVQNTDRANFLVPVDARIENQYDIEAEGIGVNHLLEELGRRPEGAVNLLVLDACRNNPFSAGLKSVNKGLARRNQALPGGTLVLYAASPGQTASDNPGQRNGLFTEKLLGVLDRGGLDIEDAFEEAAIAVKRSSGNQQVPYKEGNLLGKHYLASAAPIKPQGAESQPQDPSLELSYWQSMERCGTATCFEAYKKAYPSGRFRYAADALLAKLRAQEAAARTPEPQLEEALEPAPAMTPETVEQALGLNRDERRAVQDALNALGHDVGTADGIWGDKTRQSIRSWQGSQKQTTTGHLTAESYKQLLAQAQPLLEAEREQRRKKRIISPFKHVEVDNHEIVFEFLGPCWVDIRDSTRKFKLFGEMSKGNRKVLEGTPPYSIMLGNTAMVRVTVNGRPLDIESLSHGSIARFTLDPAARSP